MICPYCNKELPDHSKFCQYCGSRLQLTNQDDSLSTTLPKKKRPKRKRVILVSVFVMLFVLFGSYFGSYTLAKRYAREGNFASAAQLLIVPSLTRLHDPLLPSYVSAGILYENEKYTEAKDAFKELAAVNYENSVNFLDALEKTIKYYDAVAVLQSNGKNDYEHLTSYYTISVLAKNGFTLAIEGIDDAKECLYQYAVRRYREGALENSHSIFEKIPNYKRSRDYITLYEGNDCTALCKLIDFENAKEVIKNHCLEDFLRGTWKTADQKLYFTIDQDGTCTKSLPSFYSPESYYSFQDGIYFTYSKNDVRISEAKTVDLDDPAITKHFQFVIRNKDTVSVYCYYDGNTYRLYRQ